MSSFGFTKTNDQVNGQHVHAAHLHTSSKSDFMRSNKYNYFQHVYIIGETK